MTHEGPQLDVVGDYTVIDCQQCKFAHVLPLPNVADLYTDRYYEQDKPHYFTHLEEDRAWWELVYAERLGTLERWLDGFRNRRLLDIGSGPGLLIHVAMQRGWDAKGIEPSRQAYAYSRQKFDGIDVDHGFFNEEWVDTHPMVEAVHLGEVLEHVTDPAAILGQVNRVLVPGGMVCIVVPNDYSILQAAVESDVALGIGRRWWLAPPAHLNYFNIRSLHTLVKRVGFDPADATCTFPMELFLLMGMQYVGDDSLGREVHGYRKRLELSLEQHGLGDAKRELYGAWARRGIGRDIVLFAQKR